MANRDAPASSSHDPRALLVAILECFASAGGTAGTSGPAQAIWSVATPGFTARLGDPEHLARLLGNPLWLPLIGHQQATIEELCRLGPAARATLRVVASDGAEVRYLASLRRFEPADRSSPTSWMLSGLVRADLADA